MSLTLELKTRARELGFTLSGVCPAVDAPGYSQLVQWLAAGYAGEMEYLQRRLPAYRHPGSILEGARSLLMLGMPYDSTPPAELVAGEGRIARYAWGQTDYHDLIHARLKQLVRWLDQHVPGSRSRGVVDTAPLLEREFAQLAGLGWIGKHTLLINRQQGSWLFLAAVVTDVELDPDPPQVKDYCGTCRACLEACPTQAFPQPHVLDATRCISYLTIEHRSAVDAELSQQLGDWVFGCDVCQDVCPWNRRAAETAEPELRALAGRDPLPLAQLFSWDDEDFRAHFRQSPLWRSRRRGLLRNACLVLGNQGHLDAVPWLARGLNDSESLVRGAAAWALGRLGQLGQTRPIRLALEARRDVEQDREASQAIERSLAQLPADSGSLPPTTP